MAELLGLAAPIVVVQVGFMTMGVVDTIMVGHVSARDLAAAALGNVYFFGFIAFGMGLLMALDPVVAQAVGAGETPAVARALQRGLLLSAALTVPISIVFLPAAPLFTLLAQPEDVVPLAARYVHVSLPGIFPFLAFVVLRQSLQAMGALKPIVWTMVLANLLNAALCWAFVFGGIGPYRGAVGSALASTLARWAMMFGLLVIAWRHLGPLVVPPRREALQPRPLARMVAVGAPIGAQFLLEFGMFAVISLLMGRFGAVAMAAHQIAINIASLMFMVPLGISSAAAVLVGRAVGAGDAPRARRAGVAAIGSGLTFMAASGALLMLAPFPLARVYSAEAGVLALAVQLIPIAGVFQVFDGLQVVSVGVLRGIADTRAPMVVNVIGFWLIGLPVSLWLGFGAGHGAVGLWWGVVAGLAAVGLFLAARVRVRMARALERVEIEEEPARC